jgi:hypothetical protein
MLFFNLGIDKWNQLDDQAHKIIKNELIFNGAPNDIMALLHMIMQQ